MGRWQSSNTVEAEEDATKDAERKATSKSKSKSQSRSRTREFVAVKRMYFDAGYFQKKDTTANQAQLEEKKRQEEEEAEKMKCIRSSACLAFWSWH